MSKKYMDFAPVKQKPASKRVAATRKPTAVRQSVGPSSVRTAKPTIVIPEATAKKPAARKDVASSGATVSKSAVRTTTSASHVIRKTEVRNSSSGGNAGDQSVFAIKTSAKLGEIEDLNPKFVRTDVPKRPLSKNVYQKKVAEPQQPANQKPVTIITKPKKESYVGVVVTIILTIIFGAVAGTVAFLLLPK